MAQQEPFGATPPDENPSSLGAYEFNLRFPGQYADRETSLHYNYFRDYDPQIGRYVEGDPVGLIAGLNLFSYVGGRPILTFDPYGLCDAACQSANRAAGLPANASQPPAASVSIGVGYMGQVGTKGESGEVGVGVNMDGKKICVYIQKCEHEGIGLCVQGGINLGLSGPLKSGASRQVGGFAAGGVGMGANVQVSTDESGAVSGAKGLPRPGPTVGGAIGFNKCTIELKCWPD